ncbi:hypothetical protein [Shimia sagamensis]|uniref:hypothetical protein n=1 Tax=Shimia sagamensis TaxID=1566352 RepID=UPI0024B6CDBD|nr:hypothetical protein [Shimia sagamensis]
MILQLMNRGDHQENVGERSEDLRLGGKLADFLQPDLVSVLKEDMNFWAQRLGLRLNFTIIRHQFIGKDRELRIGRRQPLLLRKKGVSIYSQFLSDTQVGASCFLGIRQSYAP